MKLLIRRAKDRGHFDHSWVDTYHAFSFADYHDEAWMGFKTLRVINEDRIQGRAGFGRHGHRDMEIITYVMQGALRHTDSMGNSEVLKAGEFQRMTAGTGVLHSEENASPTDVCHLYQIWILPERRGLEPSYEQKRFVVPGEDLGPSTIRKILIASPDARDGSFKINQDAEVWLWRLEAGDSTVIPAPAIGVSASGGKAGIQSDQAIWIQVVSGDIEIGGEKLWTSDAVGLDEPMEIKSLSKSELMVFVV